MKTEEVIISGIQELEKESKVLNNQLKEMQKTTESISESLKMLKEAAKYAFPEAYQKYLNREGGDG